MARVASGGYGHRISYAGHPDEWWIAWTYDTKHGRIRFPHRVVRLTTEAGARKFAQRWKVQMPEVKT